MKNHKSTELSCLGILTFTQMAGPPKFWHVYCWHAYCFSMKFLNMCKPRTTIYFLRFGPPGFISCGSGLECLPSWLGMVDSKCKLVHVIRNFIANKTCYFSPNKLLFLSWHVIKSLFSQFCLFQNAIFHKMFQLRFWNCKPIFLTFHWLQHFFFRCGYLLEMVFAS